MAGYQHIDLRTTAGAGSGYTKNHPPNCNCLNCTQQVSSSRPVYRANSSTKGPVCCSWICCGISSVLGTLLFFFLIFLWLLYLTFWINSGGGSGCKNCWESEILFHDDFRHPELCFHRPCDQLYLKRECDPKKKELWSYRDGFPYEGLGMRSKSHHRCSPEGSVHSGKGCRPGSSESEGGKKKVIHEGKKDCNYFLFPLKHKECADDADLSVDKQGNLCVDSRPFQRTVPKTGDGAVPDGILDRFKFLALTDKDFKLPKASNKKCEELVFRVNATCNVRKAWKHPFPTQFLDTPFEDPRPAACVLTTLSLPEEGCHVHEVNGSWIEAGFVLQDRSIYITHQLLPFGKPSFGGNMKDYYGFSQLQWVAHREVWEYHDLSVAYNPSLKIIRWLIGGVEVYRVNRVGFPPQRCYRMADHGGCPSELWPPSIHVGFGTGSFLDWHHPPNGSCVSNPALVKLDSNPEHYHNPFQLSPSGNPVSPDDFVDELNLRESRLWDHGALLKLEWLEVLLQTCGCL